MARQAGLWARRILVAGASGSGKTTLAADIARMTGLPRTEIDALHWHAGWTPNPHFVEEVERLAASDAWITEWQYTAARPLLAARAELLVLLDPPAALVLARVVRRTVGRRLGREALWNGNREAPLLTFFTDPDHIVRWSVRTMGAVRPRVRAVLAERPELALAVVRTSADRRRVLALLARGSSGARPGGHTRTEPGSG